MIFVHLMTHRYENELSYYCPKSAWSSMSQWANYPHQSFNNSADFFSLDYHSSLYHQSHSNLAIERWRNSPLKNMIGCVKTCSVGAVIRSCCRQSGIFSSSFCWSMRAGGWLRRRRFFSDFSTRVQLFGVIELG